MLHWNTVEPRLKDTLLAAMAASAFKDFRLVGGTALSLHLGHRMSVDIDLFTDANYGSINFEEIEEYLTKNYPYVNGLLGGAPGMGKTYRVGENLANSVKIDIFYSMDPFFQPPVIEDSIRMATVDEIIAMKLDILPRGGRKKDFWDLHELLESYTIQHMVDLHASRFEWTHEPELILSGFTNFERADKDEDPKCLRGKEWAFIKQDFMEIPGRERPGPGFTR